MRRFHWTTLCISALGTILVIDPAEPRPGESAPVVAAPQDKPQDKPKRRAPTNIPEGQGCSTTECHEPLTEGRYIHGPVAIKRCVICHEQPAPDRHTFKKIENEARLCSSCHEILLLDLVHKPVQDGQCTACHNPHHSDHRKMLKTKKPATLCAECHEQAKSFEKKFQHEPVKAGDCTGCHSAHSSAHPHLLARRGSNTCFECHEELYPNLAKNDFWHQPAKEDCAKCHDPHASDHPFQLKSDPKQLCLDCHDELKKRIETSVVYHSALVTDKGCRNCHDPHMSKFPKMLKGRVIDLCLSCHDKPQLRKDDTVIAAVGREIRRAKSTHGPIREGDCSGCHDPHGSLHNKLLEGAYPKKFYAPFDLGTYSLCFGCHDPAIFTTKKSWTLTDFRNGDTNLHFLHVNDSKKGRACRACHATHASNFPKHMAETAPFGKWDIPLEFEERPRGGACSPGCHKPREYNREAPIDYEALARQEKAAKDKARAAAKARAQAADKQDPKQAGNSKEQGK